MGGRDNRGSTRSRRGRGSVGAWHSSGVLALQVTLGSGGRYDARAIHKLCHGEQRCEEALGRTTRPIREMGVYRLARRCWVVGWTQVDTTRRSGWTCAYHVSFSLPRCPGGGGFFSFFTLRKERRKVLAKGGRWIDTRFQLRLRVFWIECNDGVSLLTRCL